MKTIDDLIQRYDCPAPDELHTQAKLKMIKALLSEITDSKDSAYMREIVAQFAEIIEDMQKIINSQMYELAMADGYGPETHNFLSGSQPTADSITWNTACERPSCHPPEGGFQTDAQVKKAFTNYLTYHVERKTKNGKNKPFSVHTIYDYSSRIKVLMEIVYDEWQSGNGDWLQLNEQTLQVGRPFLNAYNNIDALKRYVQRKEQVLVDISMGLREAAPDSHKNPLNNIRNLKNTIASLAKFEDFRNTVENQLP